MLRKEGGVLLSLLSNEGIFTAQLHDHIEAIIRMVKEGELHSLSPIPEPVAKPSALKQIAEVISRIVDKSLRELDQVPVDDPLNQP